MVKELFSFDWEILFLHVAICHYSQSQNITSLIVHLLKIDMIYRNEGRSYVWIRVRVMCLNLLVAVAHRQYICKAWPDKWLSLTRMEPRLLYSHPDRRQTSYFPQSNSPGTTENELALINTIQLLSLPISVLWCCSQRKQKTNAHIL